MARARSRLLDELHQNRPFPSPAAEAHFHKAVELAPDLLEAHEQLFQFLRDGNKPAKALAAGVYHGRGAHLANRNTFAF